MMRRYILDMELCSVECESRGIVERSDGEWVRWEDVKGLIRGYVRNGIKAEEENTRLKELNWEMKGMLEDVLYYELPSDVYVTIKELLAKAGGEGE
jgi:hypothetical protein